MKKNLMKSTISSLKYFHFNKTTKEKFFFSFSTFNKTYGTQDTMNYPKSPDSPSIVYCLHGRSSKTCCDVQVVEVSQIDSKHFLL